LIAMEGWVASSPREELRPEFSVDPVTGNLLITTDHREGLQGWWARKFEVAGGTHLEFSCRYRAEGVECLRRNVFARIHWRDEVENPVAQTAPCYRIEHYPAGPPLAETEYPGDNAVDRDGWTEIRGEYTVPVDATTAIVELHLQWASHARVEWSRVNLRKLPPPSRRLVGLGAIHFNPPGGGTTLDNCRLTEPLIRESAEKGADLVVLGEHLPSQGIYPLAATAETIPGPATNFFAGLARQFGIHIVVGILEREGTLVYNSAILLGPGGELIGKYRKVTLPTPEVEAGLAPGDEYPVFSTRLGRVGIMICYDAFFPEVARQLYLNGAEIIAWPVWGSSPIFPAARALENQVYVVASTYEDARVGDWAVTGIYDPQGKVIAGTSAQGTVVVTSVDLNEQPYWQHLGCWRDRLHRHRP